MTAESIVTDPSLRSVLEANQAARQQCLQMLDALDQFIESQTTIPSRDVETDFAKQQKLLFSRLADVRGLNRQALVGVRQTKQTTADARHDVDTLHLQLQNLYYEQRHLSGEIAACEGYEWVARLVAPAIRKCSFTDLERDKCSHKYQQLPLIPVEEFLKEHPEHVDDDESALMVARINHEHAQRQVLEEERQGLLKKKQGLIADNNKRKEDLANLDKDLENFIDVSCANCAMYIG
jgi:THO complex subunit 5